MKNSTKYKPVKHAIELFMEENKLHGFVLVNEDAQFSYSGCECCSNGLANNVYAVEGYSHDSDQRFALELCWECIVVATNGQD